jgi:hypothetical protein
MQQPERTWQWSAGAIWLGANVVVWPAALYVVRAVPSDYGTLALVAGGCLIGLGQWAALAIRLGSSAWWGLAFGVAWFLGLLAGDRFGDLSMAPLWLGGVGGACAGVAQYLVLEPRVRRARVWVAASTVLSMAGCYLGAVAGGYAYSRGISEQTAYAVAGLVAAMFIGLSLGAVLAWLLSDQIARR